ncbi:hypothetical protein EV361DRAFT_1037999 [Lentinula raphanica]|nr:hypothetical protein EV361DRAFT_1037999 [Lentinula raphanica]
MLLGALILFLSFHDLSGGPGLAVKGVLAAPMNWNRPPAQPAQELDPDGVVHGWQHDWANLPAQPAHSFHPNQYGNTEILPNLGLWGNLPAHPSQPLPPNQYAPLEVPPAHPGIQPASQMVHPHQYFHAHAETLHDLGPWGNPQLAHMGASHDWQHWGNPSADPAQQVDPPSMDVPSPAVSVHPVDCKSKARIWYLFWSNPIGSPLSSWPYTGR